MSNAPKPNKQVRKPLHLTLRRVDPDDESPVLLKETKALLEKLEEAASHSSRDGIEALDCLVYASVKTCRFVEAMYSSPIYRPLIEKIALNRSYFATSFDFSMPTALRSNPRPFETNSDKMRRNLTKLWQTSSVLRSSGKTEYDHLRLIIEGFDRAVKHPECASVIPADDTGCSLIVWFLETKGAVSVDKSVRDRLLAPENSRNPLVWATELVQWYKDRHPWPFLDKKGDEILEYKRGKLISIGNVTTTLPDPIHQIAFRRLIGLHVGHDCRPSFD